MKNTLNIFAILLLIACTNATQKISYSDIVSSLVELSQDKDTALTYVSTIVDNFSNSNNLLTNLKAKITENCETLSQRAAEQQKKLQNKIESYQATAAKLTQENMDIATALVSDKAAVKNEVNKIQDANKSLKLAQTETVENEKAIYESINVLKRLKNLAIDELQGAQQKKTQMHKFNVTITTPPAFVQFSDFHGELKSLLSKTDSVNRGFISTLILLTQSAGKQTFSNPETVNKIIAMIDKVLSNSYEKIKDNQRQGQEKVKSYTDIIENSRTLIARLKDEIQRKISVKAANENEITFYKNDVVFLQRAFVRREKRSAFSSGLCNEQSQLVNQHYRKYVETLNQINDLRSSLNAESA